MWFLLNRVLKKENGIEENRETIKCSVRRRNNILLSANKTKWNVTKDLLNYGVAYLTLHQMVITKKCNYILIYTQTSFRTKCRCVSLFMHVHASF